ncbi:lipopolysaccharide biosynthesis protein [Pontibacter qinzhouensis]|uniref:Lipopolysaccharide biosynthesis protein n=1 Tax=Pontibacter qinzhouensis TaxID=2603253 RepID=A0A5C8KEE6_9BACT|nr:lipopolysaccharide biosynthesis protein [Pontibacter qinzhouensis]TXK52597.1 lipopolysaccharide biosynthesis protein [Pontibacter qinzhouensis]
MLKGIFWDLVDKVFNLGAGFIISVILSRILTPEDFGLVSMVMVFISFSQVFLDVGFSSALVYKQDVTEEQYSTVFYINIAIGALLTCIMFLLSEVIAGFYGQSIISSLVKGTSILFLINSLTVVQNAHYIKVINLKPLAIFRAVAVIISGVAGITMAYLGFGVWSLVSQSVLSALIFTLLIWVFSKWRPKLLFNLHSIKELWQYGSKIFIPNLLETFFSKLDVLIIGKIFPPASLGYYTRAQSLNSLIIQYSSGSLLKVFFPAISKNQHDLVKVREIYSTALIVVSFAALALLSILFVSSRSVIILLFTEKWIQSDIYFKILVLSGYAYPLSAIMVNVISGRGNSKAYLKLDLIKKAILIVVFTIGFQTGITGFLYGMVIFSFLAVLLNMYFVSVEIGISVTNQIKMVVPYFIIAASSIGLGLIVSNNVDLPNFFMLVAESATVVTSYALLNILFNSKAFLLFKGKFIVQKV